MDIGRDRGYRGDRGHRGDRGRWGDRGWNSERTGTASSLGLTHTLEGNWRLVMGKIFRKKGRVHVHMYIHVYTCMYKLHRRVQS